MARGSLLVHLADGARAPFGRDAFISLFDGAQRRVHAAIHRKPNVEFSIPVTDGPNDIYRVVASAKDHVDAGQLAIPIRAGMTSIVKLMLIPRRPIPAFRPLADLDLVHPRLRPLIEGFLGKQFGSADEASYERLQATNERGLMTLLSIGSAFADLSAPNHPLDFVDTLLELKSDRFFAEARSDMQGFLTQQPQTFRTAPSHLHPDAFASFKESRYPEGNVQFTFARINGSALLKLDGDIDLFANAASHFVLEVLPNDLFNPSKVTDARRAYALRWMSVERRRAVDPATATFDPPFALGLG